MKDIQLAIEILRDKKNELKVVRDMFKKQEQMKLSAISSDGEVSYMSLTNAIEDIKNARHNKEIINCQISLIDDLIDDLKIRSETE